MMSYLNKTLFMILIPILVTARTTDFGKPRIKIQDKDIQAGQQVHWTSDHVYLLDGLVYVEAGAALSIEAGTVIKSLQTPSTGDIATALIITRGAKIYADGTAQAPIIFTSEQDSVELKDNDINDGVDYLVDKGLWGGVILLGKALLNVADEMVVEGLPKDPRGFYGGFDDTDDSGVLRFVQIKYTGIAIEANKELQGLTLGCIGSKTIIEYIEVFASADDGFEWFGGTVNTRYLVSAMNDDDSFDYDEGFRGKGQFWFAIQSADRGNRLGEYDNGNTGALTAMPLSQPILYNVTFIGSGCHSNNKDNDYGLVYKEYGGGAHYNSIFCDFRGVAVKVDSGAGETSYNRLLNGGIKLENNIWFKDEEFGLKSLAPQKFVTAYLASHNNFIENPDLHGISRIADASLDPRPIYSSPALSRPLAAYPGNDLFFIPVSYMGAFAPDNKGNWLAGWTLLYDVGVLADVQATISVQYDARCPNCCRLEHNYPNPFNAMTRINYFLNKEGNVKLVIYNPLGQVVAVLADCWSEAGHHSVVWNAETLPAGLYLCFLNHNGERIIRKLALVK